MTARAPRRSQPPKARGGEGGTEHEHGQGKATNGGRTAGEAAQRTKASGAMAGRRSPSRKRPAEWGGGCRASERRPSEQCRAGEQCEERRDRASKPRTAGGTKDNS